ncbi:MAG: hypothetical protein NTV21_06070 [Planctomycetota bacterium]|nr:hypothetical protein [Planctomycetota bacterium]
MTDLAVLNPEVEGLLREIAADPTSSLLRLPPSDLRRARRHGHLPDRAGTTGLNLAERELLRRWREEVAYLLLVACYRELSVNPQHQHRLHRFHHEGTLNSTSIRRRAHSASLQLEARNREFEGPLQLLTRCVARDPSLRPTAFQLAEAAARLQPSDLSSCYAAVYLILEGNPIAGVRLIEAVRSQNTTVRRMTSMNAVYGYERMGRLDAALEAAESNDWPAESQVARAVIACLIAAQTQDDVRLRKWVEKLKDLNPSEGEVAEAVSGSTRRRQRGDWRPSPGAGTRLALATRDCGWEIGQVANAIP